MKRNGNDIWVLVISYVVLLIVIIAFASSCSPQRKMWNLERKHPELLLQYCASKAVTDTILIKGKDSIVQNYVIDTIALIGDTTFVTDTLPCPPVSVPTPDTLRISSVDTSGKALLRSENSRLTGENNTLEGKLSTWQFWAILGWLLVVSLAVGIGFLIKWK